MTTLERRLAHMRRLIAMDAPACLKAHYFVQVLIPRMAAEIGLSDVAREVGDALARGFAFKSGTCVMCRRSPSAPPDDVCLKCQAECDQFAAMIEAIDDDQDDDRNDDTAGL